MNHPDDPGCQSVDDGSGGQSGSTPQPTRTPEPPLVSETAIVPTPQPKPTPSGSFTYTATELVNVYTDWESYIGLPSTFYFAPGSLLEDAVDGLVPGLDFEGPDSDSYGIAYEILYSKEIYIYNESWSGLYFFGTTYGTFAEYDVEQAYDGEILSETLIEGSEHERTIWWQIFWITGERNYVALPFWYSILDDR
jgi:hypothetical protein